MKKIIGEEGVDSGQILVCDPCYIDSQWEQEDCHFDRKHKHIDGTILQYGVDFKNYESVIPKYGKTMNQINADKEAVEVPESPAEHEFSYNACCKKTCKDDDSYDGQLNFVMGHAGVGVVTSSGYGDGMYPVVADIDDKTGRVKSITVVFIDDEEEYPFDDSEERRDFGDDDE
jgi:hypothetical protein